MLIPNLAIALPTLIKSLIGASGSSSNKTVAPQVAPEPVSAYNPQYDFQSTIDDMSRRYESQMLEQQQMYNTQYQDFINQLNKDKMMQEEEERLREKKRKELLNYSQSQDMSNIYRGVPDFYGIVDQKKAIRPVSAGIKKKDGASSAISRYLARDMWSEKR